MKKKDLYRIIKEEIKGFDFLTIDEINKESSAHDVLVSKEFQTNLISDIVNNINDKNIFDNIGSIYTHQDNEMNNDPSEIELEYELQYKYNDSKIKLIIFIEGRRDEDGGIEPQDFNLKFFNVDGEELNISWIEENPELFEKVIKQLITPFLG